MHSNLFKITETGHFINEPEKLADNSLVLFFSSNNKKRIDNDFNLLKNRYNSAQIVGCTSGNQIFEEEINKEETTVLSLTLAKSQFKLVSEQITDYTSSFTCGQKLATDLQKTDLKGIFIISDGLKVNGSELLLGFRSICSDKIQIAGGLAADDANFKNTYVAANKMPEEGIIAAIGFYGENITLGFGNGGGWSEFGPKRTITKSDNNILYELDGQPALDLYKKYLGDEASGLPSSGLLFPLKIIDPNNKHHDMVRTILSVDHEKRSMTFAGTMPQGWSSQLMRGSFEKLITSAKTAAETAELPPCNSSSVALLISCIGRKLLLGQKSVEELMAVKSQLGDQIPLAGFYSYGEISPHFQSGYSDLHNQTMTIMTIKEEMAT